MNQNNNNNNNQDQGGIWKRIIPIVVVSLVLTLLVNYLYQSVSNSYLEEITFDQFVTLLDEGQIESVEVQPDRLLIVT